MDDDATGEAIVEQADALWHAEQGRAPIPPLTDARPDLTVEQAYAIQTHNVARRVAAGRVVRGRKVGLTSRRTQQLLGVHEPTFGALLEPGPREVLRAARPGRSNRPWDWSGTTSTATRP